MSLLIVALVKKEKQFPHKCTLLQKAPGVPMAHFLSWTTQSHITVYCGVYPCFILSKVLWQKSNWKFNLCFVTPTSSRNTATVSGFWVLDTQTEEHSYPWTHEHTSENDLQLLMIFLNAVQISPVSEAKVFLCNCQI